MAEPVPEEDNEQQETISSTPHTNSEENDNKREEEDDEDESFNEEDDEEPQNSPSADYNTKLNTLFNRLSTESVNLRVHDVFIKGNTKTKDSVIEAEINALNNAATMTEVMEATTAVMARLHGLDIFDSVRIMLDAGPPELTDTANVIIEVSETNNPITGEVGVFTKPEARSWSLEGSLKFKNLCGYGDLWDGSVAYGWDQTSEASVGFSLPRFKALANPVRARLFLHSQDWLKLSSYKERSLGMNLHLLSTRHHDLAYNLAWRTLTDPSQMSSRSIRQLLGHNLLSSLKYTLKIDRRNSPLRPTQGYSFVTTSQIGGLLPDTRAQRFLRQEVDLRYALPMGFYNAAINFGVSAGLIFPWGSGCMNRPSSLLDRFFLGGNSSPICTLGGPTSMLGFKLRGLGPTDQIRQFKNKYGDESSDAPGMDALGGDVAVTAFADLSFDLPLNLFREAGIHGHAFACAGNLTSLTEFRRFSMKHFLESFRSTIGLGIIVPTRLFRMEVNYCYILKQLEHDQGKTGVQLSFSSPL